MQMKNLFKTSVYTLLLALVTSTGLSSCSEKDEAVDTEIRIGALLSLTGGWNSLGKAAQEAVTIAIEDAEKELAESGRDLSISLNVMDTKLDPTIALTQLEFLSEDNFRFVIGPQSSSEVRNIKPFADENNMLIISPSSTAGSLSIAGDNIFRFSPDDSKEAEAMAALLVADSIESIVPMWRNDVGNEGLSKAIRTAFKGNVRQGVVYDTLASANFEAALSEVKAQLQQAQAQFGSHVAVYLAAFDEAASILAVAANDPFFADVKWYGSDGTALSEAIVQNATASNYAKTAGYPNPIYGLSDFDRARWQPVMTKIQQRVGFEPDAFALSCYDAVRILVRTLIATGVDADFAQIKKVFVSTANSYYGITGSTQLNAAGDREVAHFDFWSVTGSGPYIWRKSARYAAESGIVRLQ